MVTTTEEHPLTQREFYDAILPNLATKADLAQLEKKMAELEHRLTLRLGGLMLAVGALIVAVLRLWQ